MENSIHFNEEENCFFVNNTIKVDINKIEFLHGKRNLENLIKLEDNLYYYKDKLLIEILFGIKDFEKITFKNNNTDDYRFENLIIKNKEIAPPPNVKIIENGVAKYITEGKCAGMNRNMYWKVKDLYGQYYIMHVYNDIYTKFSIKDLNKILNFINIRPTWGYSNEYVKTNILINETPKVIYLHQYIMDVHLEDNSDMKKTVDHINRDKLDNRRENLRFATMNEQNLNKDKQKRQKNACSLPEGIQQTDLPIHVCYNNRCYDKTNNKYREFFTIEKTHPKLTTSWASSKSNNVSIIDKLEQTKLKLKHLNGKISDNEYKKLTEPDYTLFKGLRLSIDQRYNKYIFEYDNRTPDIRFNYKMVLTHNDLQLMIDRFIDAFNDKYKDYTMKYYKLPKPVILDFSNVDNEIIDDDETDSVNENETDSVSVDTDDEKYKEKPDLPPNFSLYIERNRWYLSFGKNINTIKYKKKIKLNCMCIQTELDKLTDEINVLYPNLKIEKYTVKNPYDFIDKKTLKEDNKPTMPPNFCITNINLIDHIQFTKKIDNKKVSYKTVIKSNDIQKELDDFVDYINGKYKLNISSQKITDTKNWQTTNKN